MYARIIMLACLSVACVVVLILSYHTQPKVGGAAEGEIHFKPVCANYAKDVADHYKQFQYISSQNFAAMARKIALCNQSNGRYHEAF